MIFFEKKIKLWGKKEIYINIYKIDIDTNGLVFYSDLPQLS